MSRDYPIGWREVRLGEIMQINSQGVIPKEYPDRVFQHIGLQNIESETGRIVGDPRAQGSEIGSRKYIFDKRHILYGRLRPYLNKTALPEFEGICSTDILPLLPNPGLVLREYLAHYLRSPEFVAYADARSSGTKMPRLGREQLRQAKVFLPPLPVQRRIVAVLEQADELRCKRAQTDELVERILPALFVKMFGDPMKNPMEWPVVRLKDLVLPTETRNPRSTPAKPFIYVDISSVDNTIGRIVAPKTLLGHEAPSRARKVIREGDVIVATTRPYLKNTALIPTELHNQICSTGFCVLRCSDSLNSKVLFTLTRMNAFTNQLIPKMRGSSYPAVSDRDVLNVAMPLPSPELQKRFSNFAGGLTVLRQQQTLTHATLDALFQTMLARAFRGELTAGLTLQEAFGLTERQMALLRILSSATQIREPVLITSTMKYAFLFQMEGIRAGQLVEQAIAQSRTPYTTEPAYDFVPYKYGPFARELYDDLEILRGSGLVRVEHPPKGEGALRERTEIYLVEEQRKVIEELTASLPEEVRQGSDAVVQAYGSLSPRQLLDVVYERYPEYTIKSERPG